MNNLFISLVGNYNFFYKLLIIFINVFLYQQYIFLENNCFSEIEDV